MTIKKLQLDIVRDTEGHDMNLVKFDEQIVCEVTDPDDAAELIEFVNDLIDMANYVWEVKKKVEGSLSNAGLLH